MSRPPGTTSNAVCDFRVDQIFVVVVAANGNLSYNIIIAFDPSFSQKGDLKNLHAPSDQLPNLS